MKNNNLVRLDGFSENGKFSYAKNAHEIAARVIDKWHSGITEAKIAYLFKDVDNWTSKGKIIMARTYKVPEQWQFLSGYDVLVVINFPVWCDLNSKQREALIDHELCHVHKEKNEKTGATTWNLVDHDVEEFAVIVQRHGLWMPDLKKFMRVAQQMTFGDLKQQIGR